MKKYNFSHGLALKRQAFSYCERSIKLVVRTLSSSTVTISLIRRVDYVLNLLTVCYVAKQDDEGICFGPAICPMSVYLVWLGYSMMLRNLRFTEDVVVREFKTSLG